MMEWLWLHSAAMENSYDYPDFHLKMHCFLATVKDGKLKLLEHADARWLGKNTIHTIDWLPADIELVEQVVKKLEAQL